MILIPFVNGNGYRGARTEEWENLTEEELQKLTDKASAGDSEAQLALGYYYCGEAERKLELLQNLPSGNPLMRGVLSLWDSNPVTDALNEDRKTAFGWFQKSAAQGSAEAIYQLSLCYTRGEGTPTFTEKGLELLKKSAGMGCGKAQYDLGMLYLYGEKSELDVVIVPQNHKLAIEWLTKAAEGGDGLAQFYLAQCYEEGEAIPRDFDKAFHWYRCAAESEYPLAWAVNKLGECFEKGHGTEKDEKHAIELYREAAELGDVAGAYNLGRCYEEGAGVEEDIQQALSWYEKAAENGDEQAWEALDRLKEE